ncbi:hypothetical protein I6N90_01665 [Paenibacillus sp. GSMTC-2017]|uniref:hypothetical protein n=1 Tax=Paenibacillus sp. GSMTC-2017 TaxID=2794350 RepID=UPI0018DA28F3|nr:hypothetical protein [Paenibacillus sp. GSMTC-2017]MBH5316512.1 hypothetical protein [Paenibacillus sp. GSMTC-2017]
MKMNRILALTLALSLLAATPVIATSPSGGNGSDNGTEVVQYSELDATFKEAAEKAVVQYGNGKSFKLENVIKSEYFVDEKNNSTRWLIENKDRSAIVSVDAISGELLTLFLGFDISEVKGGYDKYIKAAQSSAKQLNAKSGLAFTRAELFVSNLKSNKKQSISFYTKDEQFIALDVNTSKLNNYRLKFKETDVDRNIVSTAEQALKSMGNNKSQPFTHIERNNIGATTEKEEIWILQRKIEVKDVDRKKYNALERTGENKWLFGESQVVIDGKTGKLISITVSSKKEDQKQKKLTEKQGVALAKTAAKKLFGVDLSSYKVKVDKEWGDYTFSSKGKESIVAKFNNFGDLVRMERVVNK